MPAEYAAASAQAEAGGKGKGKAAAHDSGKGKVGGLAAAAPPRCPILSVTCCVLLLLVLRLVCTPQIIVYRFSPHPHNPIRWINPSETY